MYDGNFTTDMMSGQPIPNPLAPANFMLDMTTNQLVPNPLANPTQDSMKPMKEEAKNAFIPELSEEDSTVVKITPIKPNLDPATLAALSQIPNDPECKVGAYIDNGNVMVYVDTVNVEKAHAYSSKQLAFNYRHALNMPDAGIQVIVLGSALTPNANPPSAFAAIKGLEKATIYRSVFQLTRGL